MSLLIAQQCFSFIRIVCYRLFQATMLRAMTLPTAQDKADLAAEFEQAVAEVLVAKALAAARRESVRHLVVAGGVGANARLRRLLATQAGAEGIDVFHPPLEFCTDNGAMVAFAAAARLAAGVPVRSGPQPFDVKPRWELEAIA
jgi:N6-L-threonylcarbamoyladenine synthase